MPLGLEAVLGYNGDLTTGSFVALTPGNNQTFNIRNFTSGKAYLEEIWAEDDTSAYTLSIKSPKMHDDVYGILLEGTPLDYAAAASHNPQTLLPGDLVQEVYATDQLSVTVEGTTSDKFAALFLIRYEDISGIAARLYMPSVVMGASANLAGVRVEAETSGTAGQWGTSVLFNSGLYKLKANTDYAILGFTTSQPVVGVALNGTDFGNLNVGGPGFFDQRWGGTYFVDLSNRYGTAHVPVFNSNNAENINVMVADTATSTEIFISFVVVQLNQLLPTPQGGPGQ
ncbi:MAG TPA: hypothetical protein VMH39_08970 [Gemmatimonadaceae bacterium]|nr:hypothetical protein [Gemmatimonadaceae bacterium]